MSDPLFWIGFLIGTLVGAGVGMFATALMLATRDEQQKTGH